MQYRPSQHEAATADVSRDRQARPETESACAQEDARTLLLSYSSCSFFYPISQVLIFIFGNPVVITTTRISKCSSAWHPIKQYRNRFIHDQPPWRLTRKAIVVACRRQRQRRRQNRSLQTSRHRRGRFARVFGSYFETGDWFMMKETLAGNDHEQTSIYRRLR